MCVRFGWLLLIVTHTHGLTYFAVRSRAGAAGYTGRDGQLAVGPQPAEPLNSFFLLAAQSEVPLCWLQ